MELVAVTTADRLRLHGMLQTPEPADEQPPPLAVDAVLCVHGTGSNFYSSTLFDALGERFLAAGAAVLRINTRGHDGVSTAQTDAGGIVQGAAFEIVDDCRHDLAAWVDLLAERGYARVALVGHSAGAVKCIYYLATATHRCVSHLAAISPPRLSHRHFLQSTHADEFARDLAAAEAAVAAEQGDALLSVRFPLPYLISAKGYLDKYGPAERYNVLELLPRVSTPALLVFGGAEIRSNAAFVGLPEAIESLPPGSPRRVSVVAEADHFYSGARRELAGQILRWLRNSNPST